MTRELITIIIITFITALGWFAFSVYHATIDTTIDEKYKNIEDLDSYFDEDVLKDLKERTRYNMYTRKTE